MKKEYRINENELLNEKDFAVKALFDMISDSRLKAVIEGLSLNHGFGENYGACVFWDDLDDFDKENTEYYEGAEFGLYDGTEVVIGYRELLYYINIACQKYCVDYPEDKEVIDLYIQNYKKINDL